MKGGLIEPPFPMNSGVHREWVLLQQELGGIRGKGFSDHQVWKLAIIAEHQADWRRGHIEPKYYITMQEYRQQFGLPPLPKVETKKASPRTGRPVHRVHGAAMAAR